MIYLYLLLFFFIIYVFAYKISTFYKLYDYPNNRKIHLIPTPTIGGLVIFISILFSVLFTELNNTFYIIIYSSLILLLIGFLDDIRPQKILIRMIFQIIASLIVVGSGLYIVDIGEYIYLPNTNLGYFGILLTLFSVICFINAMNFLDGLDGLCSGIILISIATLILYAFFEGNIIIDEFLFYFFFIIFIFFIININIFPINKIFLGDGGSTAISYVFAWLLIYYSHPSNRLVHPILAAWCVSIPMFDFLSIILRRILLKKSPFAPDQKHIHHILLNIKFGHKKTLLIILFLCIIFNSLGYLTYSFFGSTFSFFTFIIVFLIYYYFISYFSSKNDKFLQQGKND